MLVIHSNPARERLNIVLVYKSLQPLYQFTTQVQPPQPTGTKRVWKSGGFGIVQNTPCRTIIVQVISSNKQADGMLYFHRIQASGRGDGTGLRDSDLERVGEREREGDRDLGERERPRGLGLRLSGLRLREGERLGLREPSRPLGERLGVGLRERRGLRERLGVRERERFGLRDRERPRPSSVMRMNARSNGFLNSVSSSFLLSQGEVLAPALLHRYTLSAGIKPIDTSH